MNDVDERVVGGYRVRIDRTLCVGFGDCISEAPVAFQLDTQDVVAFTRPEQADGRQLLRACAACPVDALTVVDTCGRELVPGSNVSASGKSHRPEE